ncbi:MAG TPA: ATP:cob(I)alamin adenosyltransferase, partial [Sphingomicrobium sp.]|nr:ATP:cob(I)alamin adenosyltransferase [Sphingomicrobium sp.]
MVRLNRIYTRTGDSGETGLVDGSRIAKDHPRAQAIGDVDELHSAIGLAIVHVGSGKARAMLGCIQ